jgi:hypothetical protein
MAMMACGCVTPVRPPSPAHDLDARVLLEAPVPEHEHYYLIMFGSDKTPRLPRYTHTWMTMVRTVERPGAEKQIAEVHTISWMPATLKIRPFSRSVEPGVNLDLETTLKEMEGHSENIAMWGPHECWSGLYRRFTTQKAHLETNAIGYQCTDGFGEAARKGTGCNCFHALSDMDPQFDRKQYPLIFYGTPASENIMRQIAERPVLIHPRQTHDWLIPALGLDRHKIDRRCLCGDVKEFSREEFEAALEQGPNPRRRLRP